MTEEDVLQLVRTWHRTRVAEPVWTHRDVPPASEDVLKATEEELGFALPAFLRRVYLEIANGVLTRAYNAVAGVRGGLLLEDDSAIDRYLSWRKPIPESGHWKWPVGLLPLSHWGGAKYSCVDCTTELGPVFTFLAPYYTADKLLEEVLVPDTSSVMEWFMQLNQPK